MFIWDLRGHFEQPLQFPHRSDLPPGHNVIWLRDAARVRFALHFSELRRRGAFLFWDRNGPPNGDPLRVIRTLAFQLAYFNRIFAAKLAGRIEESPDITTSPVDIQFRKLLEEPRAELTSELDMGPLVIVLDALDECGTAATKKRLLHTLSNSLTKLPIMFQLLITNRDESNINAALSYLNVDVHDAPVGEGPTSSDIGLLFQQQLTINADAFVGRHLHRIRFS